MKSQKIIMDQNNMYSPLQLHYKIKSVLCIHLDDGCYRIEAQLDTGYHVVLLEKSSRAPTHAQLYRARANGNSSENSHGKYFRFAKNLKNVMYPVPHLKTFIVQHV